MAIDKFSGYGDGLSSPASNAASVTPNDGVDLAYTSRGLHVGGGGDIAVYMPGGTTAVVFKSVASGSLIPIRVDRVLAAGTTATDIVAVW